MHSIRFQEWSHEQDTLALKGNTFQAVIQLLQGGVWRVYVWHRLEDVEKSSWILEPSKSLPFEVLEADGKLKLSAFGVTPFECTLDDFSWNWGTVEAKSMMAHSFNSLGGNTADMNDLATGEGNPAIEVTDGLPVGTGVSLVLKDPESRAYYGLGERTGFLNKRGRTWTNWATDEFNGDPDKDPLYQAHPYVMGIDEGKTFGLYLDETWKTKFDLSDSEADRTYIHSEGPTFDLYLIPGPSPREVLERFTSMCGRAPLPPLWALGMHQCRWSYPDDKAILSIAKEYRNRDLPLDAMWMDIDYMDGYKNFTFHPGRFPEPKELIDELKEMEIKTVVIVDAGLKKEDGFEHYEEGKKLDAFIKNRRDEELVGEVWPNPAVWPDFTRADVREWWGRCHKIYKDAGVDGIWNDMNEPAAFGTDSKTIPLGSKQGRHWHAEVHNLYGYHMSQATSEGMKALNPDKRPFALTRSGFTGIQKYAFVWTGDNHSYWDRLEMSIPMILNLSMSGVSFAGSDIGGFSANCDGELLTRWTWLGSFYPFMRNHAGKGSRKQEPWAFGKKVESDVGEAIRFRYQMLPHIYTLAEEATRTGVGMMRPLFFEHPNDPETKDLFDQFYFGKNLVAAPVVRPGQSQRMVYLPEGKWQDFWSGKTYDGQQWIIVPAPTNQVPLFQKAGSAIPTTKSARSTSDAHWNSICWKLSLAENIEGQAYCDEGDGYQAGSFQSLSGTFQFDRLNLTLDNRPQNGQVTIEIKGVEKPIRNTVPCHLEGDTLIIEATQDDIEIVW